MASDAGLHSFEGPEYTFELSSEQKEVRKCSSSGKALGSTNSETVYLRDAIRVIAHTYKLLHPLYANDLAGTASSL